MHKYALHYSITQRKIHYTGEASRIDNKKSIN